LLNILLVDDNPADVVLMQEALVAGRYQSHISNVVDGKQAMAFLNRLGQYGNAARPDLVILDLNLPKKNGRAVLAEIKTDVRLRTIPVIILSASRSMMEIVRCYELGANCYVSKPGNLEDYFHMVKSIEEFWFGSASLPREGNQ
jgi:two-component system, chemotaxis family, response regulator Rcp1